VFALYLSDKLMLSYEDERFCLLNSKLHTLPTHFEF